MSERFIRTTKNLLQKHGRMTQLELDEMLLRVKAQVQPEGQASAIAHILGRSVMTAIPNSLDNTYDWRENIKKAQLRETSKRK